jgi:TRAP-type C4-dicarboxylate transport system permease small subunit
MAVDGDGRWRGADGLGADRRRSLQVRSGPPDAVRAIVAWAAGGRPGPFSQERNMHWLSRVNGWIRGILNIVVIIAIVGLTATMTIQVILRYLLQWSLMGVEEMSTLFGLWLYFAGLALVSAHNQHIRGGFVASTLSEPTQDIVDRIVLSVCAVLCLYFLILSLDYMKFVFEVNRRSTFLRWPTVLWVASLNLGLLLSVITFTIQAISPPKKATR